VQGRAPLIAAILCLTICGAHTACCAAPTGAFSDCGQMGIDVRLQLPRHLELPMRRSIWLACLRDVFGYRWVSDDESASLGPHPAALIDAMMGSASSCFGDLAPRSELIGLEEGVRSLAWACGAQASIVSGWLASSRADGTVPHGHRLRADDGFALLLTALRSTVAPDAADPADTVRGFYVALGKAVASPSATGIRQLERWCCGDALARLTSNLTTLGADTAFCLISMRVLATTRMGHLATVRVVRTADQRLAGSTGRSTVEDQFYLRFTNQGWRIYR
jgi:hypothetical protein